MLILLLQLSCATPQSVRCQEQSVRFQNGYDAYQQGKFNEALALWRPLAKDGHGLSQFNLGIMYAEGRGVGADQTEARRWLEKAATQNIREAQFNLASLHLAGGSPNYGSAKGWLEKAADAGLDRAQHTLAKLYEYGLGTPIDDAKAFHYLSLAGTEGHSKAMYSLGKYHRDGRGTPANSALSIKWFRAAAESGHAKAQAKLGSNYAAGQSVPQNDLEAYVWTALAAKHGLASAASKLAELEARLTPELRRQADERIANFEAKGGK